MGGKTTILDKLKKYEKEGYYFRPIEDIYALIQHIADLEEEIEDLRVEAREKDAWEGRYWALLEECEAGRPRPGEGDGGRPAHPPRNRQDSTGAEPGHRPQPHRHPARNHRRLT